MGELDRIRNLKPRVIIGIETGDVPYYLAAVAAEVEGRGDETICNLIYYIRYELPEDLQRMLAAVAVGGELNGEDMAGINFLVLHNLSAMYHELLDEAQLNKTDVHLVGLKCMEIGGRVFPADPSVFSEMIDCTVASHFSIDVDGSNSLSLPVREALLKELVEEMIDKFELEDEAREALGVALLANEALYFESAQLPGEAAGGAEGSSTEQERSELKVQREEGSKAVLYGKFYFPE